MGAIMALKILVCVRPVPVSGSTVRVNAAATGYDDTDLSFQVNEYDLVAMEEAIRIRERCGGEVTALTVAPARFEATLRKAMNLGADRGALIAADPAADALATACLLAAWARAQAFDLILAGVMSEDLQRAQTGPMLAALLGLPCATTVIGLELLADRRLRCQRELEGGRREEVELALPALITVQSGLNIPRYGSLSNVLRVKRMSIPVIPATDLGEARQGERVRRAELARAGGRCEFIGGPPAAMADELARRLETRGLLRR
jgi:electron transfer flavoprotein beta subunit